MLPAKAGQTVLLQKLLNCIHPFAQLSKFNKVGSLSITHADEELMVRIDKTIFNHFWSPENENCKLQ
jgi:hypothetical protein